MKEISKPSIAKLFWLSAAVSLLGLALYSYDGSEQTRDYELILLYGMTILSFPSSIALAVLLGALLKLVELFVGPISLTSSHTLSVLVWTAMVCVGYVQWFFVVPWLYRRLWTPKG